MMVALAMALAALSGTAPALAAAEPSAVFTFDAEPGAHPVDNRSDTWSTPGWEIRVWEHEAVVKVDAATWSGADFIRVELNGPAGAPLATGSYPGARNPGDPTSPGLRVISNGLGCADHYGEFTITHLERDSAGSLTALEATFTQRCGTPTAPTLQGIIQFAA
ncbi:hypothetical protein [Actinophytocola xinjiangensis]|nr:hypothetical protein [Actinophytocola xinjiangensis]